MGSCADIRRSIEVGVPVEFANEEWTHFLFYLHYIHASGPDIGDVEPDEGFVRLESIDDGRTLVTVDLNYCSQYEGLDDEKEIAEVQLDLDRKLGVYKQFVERSRR